MNIHLRKLEEKDAEGMLEWMHDADIQKNFRLDGSNKSKEDVIAFINDAETAPVNGKSIHLAIADEHNEYLGTISLKNVDMEAKNAEYAISLRKKAQGQGIGLEATRKVLSLAFEVYELEKVYLNVFSDNINAICLYEKCGFVCEGEFRRHLYLNGEYKSLKWYSMLKEEFQRNLK